MMSPNPRLLEATSTGADQLPHAEHCWSTERRRFTGVQGCLRRTGGIRARRRIHESSGTKAGSRVACRAASGVVSGRSTRVATSGVASGKSACVATSRIASIAGDATGVSPSDKTDAIREHLSRAAVGAERAGVKFKASPAGRSPARKLVGGSDSDPASEAGSEPDSDPDPGRPRGPRTELSVRSRSDAKFRSRSQGSRPCAVELRRPVCFESQVRMHGAVVWLLGAWSTVGSRPGRRPQRLRNQRNA